MKDTSRSSFAPERLRRATLVAAAFALASALGTLAGAARAQTPEPAVPQPVPQKATPPAAAAAMEPPGKFYAFGGGAAFTPEKNSGLQNERGNLLNFMIGAGYRTSPNLAVELALLFDNRQLDTPLVVQNQLPPLSYQPGTLKSYMFTSGFAASAKYSFTAEGLTPYLGGGLGYYATRFQTTSEALGCSNNCSNTGPRISAHSNGIGYHAFVGADFNITRKDIVAAEIRYLKLDADFGSVLNETVNAGGTLFWVGYRRVFF